MILNAMIAIISIILLMMMAAIIKLISMGKAGRQQMAATIKPGTSTRSFNIVAVVIVSFSISVIVYALYLDRKDKAFQREVEEYVRHTDSVHHARALKDSIESAERIAYIKALKNDTSNYIPHAITYEEKKRLGFYDKQQGSLDPNLELIDSYPEPAKCNLWKTDFVLNTPITDPEELSKLSKRAARYAHSNLGRKDEDCPYERMDIVRIFMNKSDYDEWKGNHLVNCSITPSSPDGDVFLRFSIINKYK